MMSGSPTERADRLNSVAVPVAEQQFVLNGRAGGQVDDRLRVQDEALLVECRADAPEPDRVADVELQLRLTFLALGDVDQLGVKDLDRAVGATDGSDVQEHPDHPAVGQEEAVLGSHRRRVAGAQPLARLPYGGTLGGLHELIQ
jgi:hypothetical protein